jgi:hypothetical protein
MTKLIVAFHNFTKVLKALEAACKNNSFSFKESFTAAEYLVLICVIPLG